MLSRLKYLLIIAVMCTVPATPVSGAFITVDLINSDPVDDKEIGANNEDFPETDSDDDPDSTEENDPETTEDDTVEQPEDLSGEESGILPSVDDTFTPPEDDVGIPIDASSLITIDTITGQNSIERNWVDTLIGDLTSFIFGDPKSITLEGSTLPDARLSVILCFTILETESDEEGQWVMEIPREYLHDGENQIYGQVGTEEVTSEIVELARVEVDSSQKMSRTVFFGIVLIIVLVFTIQLVGYITHRKFMVEVKKSKKATAKQQRKLEQKSLYKKMWKRMVMADILAIFLLATVFYTVYQADLTVAASYIPANPVDINDVNNVRISDGTDLEPTLADLVSLTGVAPAQEEIAITICENHPLRELTVPDSGVWFVDLPINAFPETSFQLSSQVKDNGEYGPLFGISNMTVDRPPFKLIVWGLFILHYLALLLSLVYLWKYIQVVREGKPDSSEK